MYLCIYVCIYLFSRTRQICGNAGEVERALALFHDWDAQGVDMDVYCFNAIMGAVLKNGLPEKVFEVRAAFWGDGLMS